MADKYIPQTPDGAHQGKSSDGKGIVGNAYDENGNLVDNVTWIKVDDDDNDNDDESGNNQSSQNAEAGAVIIAAIVTFVVGFVAYQYGQHKDQVNNWFSDRFTGVKDFFSGKFKKKKNNETNKLNKKMMKEPEVAAAAKELTKNSNDISAQEHFIKALLLSETLKDELEEYYKSLAKERGIGPLDYDEYREKVEKLTIDNIKEFMSQDPGSQLSAQHVTDILERVEAKSVEHEEANPEEMQELLEDKNDQISLKQKKHI